MKEYDAIFTDIRQLETNFTSVILKFLLSGTEYSFEVSAVSGGGQGESVLISVKVPESGKTKSYIMFKEKC